VTSISLIDKGKSYRSFVMKVCADQPAQCRDVLGGASWR